MDHDFYARKAEIRRLVEAEGIPYTYISCNFFMRYLLPSLVQPGLKVPPRDEVTIFGDGNVKGLLTCILARCYSSTLTMFRKRFFCCLAIKALKVNQKFNQKTIYQTHS